MEASKTRWLPAMALGLSLTLATACAAPTEPLNKASLVRALAHENAEGLALTCASSSPTAPCKAVLYLPEDFEAGEVAVMTLKAFRAGRGQLKRVDFEVVGHEEAVLTVTPHALTEDVLDGAETLAAWPRDKKHRLSMVVGKTTTATMVLTSPEPLGRVGDIVGAVDARRGSLSTAGEGVAWNLSWDDGAGSLANTLGLLATLDPIASLTAAKVRRSELTLTLKDYSPKAARRLTAKAQATPLFSNLQTWRLLSATDNDEYTLQK